MTPRYFKKKPDIKEPKALDNVMSNAHSLQGLLSKAKIIEQFDLALVRHLPDNLSSHCRAMNYELGILAISIDNAAWATRLRYNEHELLQQLQQEPSLPNVLGFRYKIR